MHDPDTDTLIRVITFDNDRGLNTVLLCELIKKRSLTINNLLNELSTASLQSSTG